MKNILLLGLSLLLTVQVALAIPAGLAVRSERGLPFRLRLDGYRIGGRAGMTDVRFERLAPGQHWAEFQLPANGGVLSFRTRVDLVPGRESRFVLVTRRGYPPVLQRVSEAPLSGWAGGRGPGRPDDYGYQCQPTPFGGPSSWPAPGTRDDWYGRNDEGSYDNGGYGSNHPGPSTQPPAGNYGGGYPQPGPGNSGGYGNGTYTNHDYGNGGYANQRHLLTPQETEQLFQAVKARSFEDQKVLLAKQALAESDIRSEDLRRLLQGFDFDRGRVELAKFAYGRVADRQNFYRVYDVFTFDASVREMQQFIEQNRGA
ncbi:DUF4476 domain-containing protein [Hymenobacter sp. 15J16-1T3B]|uniref:DUF4476 domain-containing protein n=1 Tax=Hymenobacter sp. 15J16-1T3B TaxID=2886941 RepID=UPI001D0F8734|nr:DUF4476 domain-containing protein [Hymenobacter sp. 15J16-1T3B]MCC3156020.1 DUF4476 domain-containing protein [Hymenobacter sp. 15J16-1T3B]